MQFNRIAVSVAFCLSVLSAFVDAQDGKLYWSERNAGLIRRANLNGSQIETVLSGLSSPEGVAVDGVGEWLYFLEQGAQQGQGRLRRARLDGTMVQNLVTNLTFPFAVAIDPVNERVYFSDAVDGVIRSCDYLGNNLQTLLSNVLFPFGVALDIPGGKIYWSTDGENRLRRANLNGANIEDLVSAGVLSPFGVSLDLIHGHMYWCDQAPLSRINRANLDGSNVIQVIGAGIVAPVGIAVDAAGGQLYFASVTQGVIHRANVNGTQLQNIVTGLTTPKHVALDLVPLGACCRGVLGCQRLKQHQCANTGGSYLGDGTICLPTNTCGDAETDQCAIAAGQPDCQPDGIPDACQTQLPDCQPDGIPDQCQLSGNDSIPPGGDAAPDECNHACLSSGECPSGFECVDQICVRTCTMSAECDDARVCTFDECVSVRCYSTAIGFGDVNNSGGAANLDDILCVLRGFATLSQCPNADLAPYCSGNNQVNLDDILAVTAAFGGFDPCACSM